MAHVAATSEISARERDEYALRAQQERDCASLMMTLTGPPGRAEIYEEK